MVFGNLDRKIDFFKVRTMENLRLTCTRSNASFDDFFGQVGKAYVQSGCAQSSNTMRQDNKISTRQPKVFHTYF